MSNIVEGVNEIKKSGLFNEDFYLKKYGNQLGSNVNLIEHYLVKGYKEGMNPSPDFETVYYLNRYPDVKNSGMNPLIHYVLYGNKEHRFTNLKMELDYLEIGIKSIIQQNLFDENYYFNNYGKMINGMDCLTHYISFGFKEGKNPSANFDNDFYLLNYPDTQLQNPLIHYALYGRKKGYFNKEEQCYPKTELDKVIKIIKEHHIFDSKYYLVKYDDVNRSGMCPVTHYIKYGFNENRKMSTKYNFKEYVNENNLAKNVNPLVHFALNYDNLEDLEKLAYPKVDYSLFDLHNNKFLLNPHSDYNYIFFASSIAQLNNQYKFISRDSNSIKLSKNSLNISLVELTSNTNFEDMLGNKSIYENFFVGDCSVYRTISSEDNKHVLNYWFSKDNNNYKYVIVSNNSQDLLEFDDLHSEICRIIDTTVPIFDNVKEHLSLNYLASLDDDEFNERIRDIINKFKNKISIIIPIYNAFDDTKACIESVFKNTVLDFNLYLIDDVSTDSRIASLLNQYEKYDNVFVIRNSVNKGFTRNVNMGMELSDTDVILLNSDTIVTKNWDRKLVLAAYSNKNIATVTPMSNASDISVPVMGKDNKIPNFLDIDKMGKLIENFSVKGNIMSPTGNGFCLFIKREALNDLGLFDENAFDKGYGEETDFTMRVRKKGWINVRNDSIFIFHNRSSSFSSTTANQLRNDHRHILDERYPKLSDDWNEFVKSIDLNNSNYLVNYALDNFEEEFIKTNILYITDIENELPNIDDIDCLLDEFNIFILTLEFNNIKLWSYDSNYKLIDDITFDKEIPNIGKLNIFYMHIFHNLKIDLVFLRFSKSFQIPYTPEIIPLIFASKIKIPILYGRYSKDLLKQLHENSLKDSIKIDFNKEKGVVYTALFGGYEDLLDPKVIHPSLDYVCFTDDSTLKSDIWDIRVIDDLDVDNTRKARIIKILPQKYLNEYDFSIWVDAGFQIIGDLEDYVNTYSKEGLLLGIKHSWRDSIYEEFDAVLHYKKEEKSIVDSVKKRYESEGFPKDVGLIESGLLFRRHNNPKIIDLMEKWYFEVINFSKRDQLSFDYLCWKNNFVYDVVPIFYWKNQYVEHFFHFQEVINNKITYSQFKIILIANNDFESTKQSIDYINNINNNFSISILSLRDYSSLEDYNVKNYRIEYPEEFISYINQIANNSAEDFIYLICSGDYVKYSDIKEIINLSKKEDFKNIGVLSLGDNSYIEKNIFSNFNNFISNNCDVKNYYGVLINRKLLSSKGGFKIDSEFINNFIRQISDEYKIVNLHKQ